MRLLPVVTVIALLASLAAGAPGAAAAKKRSCMKARGATIAITTSTRLFTTRGGNVLWGCVRGRKPRRLAANFDDEYTSSAKWMRSELAGNYAAYGYESTDVSCKAACPPDYETTRRTVYIVNLITGKEAAGSEWNGEPFVLTSTGAVAWISGTGNAARKVLALFMGVVSEQDSGAIDDDSLEASFSRVTWMKNGQIRGAFFG